MRFACISDLHLSSSFGGASGHEWLDEFLAQLGNDGDVDHLVVAGDITGTFGLPHKNTDLETFRSLLQSHGWYDGRHASAVPGNHDNRVFGVGPQTRSSAQFRAALSAVHNNTRGPYQHPFYKLLPGVALVGLDTTSQALHLIDDGELGEQQLDELDRILAMKALRNRHVIVAMHHPPWRSEGLSDAPDFWDIVDSDRVDLVVCGHLHESFEEQKRGVPVVGVGGFMETDGYALLVDADGEGLLSYQWWSPWP